jgi:N-acetylglucosaminyldiphosphoundecaprenol N-acetyl-beta-D-mannosaminyltransferase
VTDYPAVELFGLEFFSGTRAELVALIGSMIERDERGVTVVPVNAQLIDIIHSDSGFRSTLASATIRIADGMPLIWLAKVLRRPFAERIAGRDLWLDLCKAAAEAGRPVYLVGDSDNTMSHLIDRLKQDVPSLVVAEALTAPPRFDPNGRYGDEMVQAARRSGAEEVYIGLGAPRQELWLTRAANETGLRLLVAVGGSFRVYTGLLHPAPAWIANAGFEWLWRWMQEPVRLFPRYTIGNIRFLYRVIKYLSSR